MLTAVDFWALGAVSERPPPAPMLSSPEFWSLGARSGLPSPSSLAPTAGRTIELRPLMADTNTIVPTMRTAADIRPRLTKVKEE
jgi:hypothetical protein